ncbi:transposase [Gracilibacillus halophilus YIM-C55.5]|uniref:Transposase n=1 Tax=Gracilibacillus halophilus YIM-C55.5 TaxID=1308866 RepID=N4WCX3_9BACI|nr:T7SS effector LXG polymorphic toxin [Gracilibacillus halophilus]ENH98123.1 transposase [Gracilibacillus halophilus YIM-C55.5]
MANRQVHIAEVRAFHDELKRNTTAIQDQLHEIQSNIDQIIQLDDFQGKSADAAKDYFQVFHGTLIQAFQGIFEQLEKNVSKHLEDFQQEIDPHQHAIIQEEYLEAQEHDIINTYEQLDRLAYDARQIIHSVSDLTSATAPSTAHMVESRDDSLQVMNKLDRQTEHFSTSYRRDHEQMQSAFQEIESLMSKVSSHKPSERTTDWFSDQLPRVQSFVAEAKEQAGFQHMLTNQKAFTRNVNILEHSIGLKQYVGNTFMARSSSTSGYAFMSTQLQRTIEDNWRYHSLSNQVTLMKKQTDFLPLTHQRDTNSLQDKMERLRQESSIDTNTMSEEEKRAIQSYLQKLENGEIESTSNVEDYELGDYPEPSFRDQQKVLGGMRRNEPGNFGRGVSATFDFFTEDMATIVDPNASASDKALASLFTFVKPAKLMDKAGDIGGTATRRFGNKGINKANPEKVVNALSNFQSRKMTFGNQQFLLDKKGMKHILERHHPEYWNGTVKKSQTFLDKNLSVDDVANITQSVMKQNRATLINRGTTSSYQISGTVNGIEYVVGLNKGKIGQLYSK